MGTELHHADRRNRHTAKLTIAFRNFANSPNRNLFVKRPLLVDGSKLQNVVSFTVFAYRCVKTVSSAIKIIIEQVTLIVGEPGMRIICCSNHVLLKTDDAFIHYRATNFYMLCLLRSSLMRVICRYWHR